MSKNIKKRIIILAVGLLSAIAFIIYMVNPMYRFYFNFRLNSDELYAFTEPFLTNDDLIFSEDMYNSFVRKPFLIERLYGGIFLEYFDSEKNSALYNLLNSPFNFVRSYKEGFIITSDLNNIPKSDGTKIYITPITPNIAYIRFAYKRIAVNVLNREQLPKMRNVK